VRYQKYLPPMLAVAGDRLAPGAEWVHELKFDGCRVVITVDRGQVRAVSRGGNVFSGLTARAGEVAARVQADSAVLDGEAVAFGPDGRPCFQTAVRLLRRDDAGAALLRIYLFDILECEGRDLRGEALLDRRRMLRRVVQYGGLLRLSPAVGDQRGERFLRKVDSLGYEGVVSKKGSSPYLHGRSEKWRKLPLRAEGRFLIGGAARRRGETVLLLGVWEGVDHLRYVGRVSVGRGWKEDLEMLHELLQKWERASFPFSGGRPATGAGQSCPVQPVQPVQAVRVHYTEITPGGGLRHPLYGGTIPCPPHMCSWFLLEKNRARAGAGLAGGGGDAGAGPGSGSLIGTGLSPGARSARVRVGGDVLRLTHLDRQLGERWNMSKMEALDYYWQVRDGIIRQIASRPLLLTRYPRGARGAGFYQRSPPEPRPDWLETVTLSGEGDDGAGAELVVCNDERALLWLINLGAYEIHPLPENPDRGRDIIILDLDPAGTAGPKEVVRAALAVEQLLGRAGVRSWVKTSGGSGVHAHIPLARPYTAGQVTMIARIMGEILAAARPHLFTLERSRDRRGGRIYVDHLQNRRGATVVAPYCIRVREKPRVSVPLRWSELYAARGVGLPAFSPGQAAARFNRRGDLWAGLQESEGYELRDLLQRMRRIAKRR